MRAWVVEDHSVMRYLLGRYLETLGVEVQLSAATLTEVEGMLLPSDVPDLAIVDWVVGGATTSNLIDWLVGCGCKVLVLTGAQGPLDVHEDLVTVLRKPATMNQIGEVLGVQDPDGGSG